MRWHMPRIIIGLAATGICSQLEFSLARNSVGHSFSCSRAARGPGISLDQLPVFGDPLHFLTAQKQFWYGFVRWPFPSVVSNWYGVNHSSADSRLIQYGGPLAAFAIASAALVAAPFLLRPCYALYLALSWIMVFCNNFLPCSPRSALQATPIFPIFILLARRNVCGTAPRGNTE